MDGSSPNRGNKTQAVITKGSLVVGLVMPESLEWRTSMHYTKGSYRSVFVPLSPLLTPCVMLSSTPSLLLPATLLNPSGMQPTSDQDVRPRRICRSIAQQIANRPHKIIPRSHPPQWRGLVHQIDHVWILLFERFCHWCFDVPVRALVSTTLPRQNNQAKRERQTPEKSY